jgi:hypothetical protein
MSYSLKQAADATGRSKPTILRAIQTGKISAKKDEHGEWQIEPAELHRVYEPEQRNGKDDPQLNDTQQPDDPDNATYETGLLRGELEQVRQRLTAIEGDRERERREAAEHIIDLRRRLDQANEERREKDRQLTALLTDQRPKETLSRRWRLFQRG